MAALPENVKARIVQGLACFDTPSQVAKDVYAEFGLTVAPQHCESYDPTKAAGAKVGKKRRAEFVAIRAAFLADLGQSAMSHRAVRLRRLERLMTRAGRSRRRPSRRDRARCPPIRCRAAQLRRARVGRAVRADAAVRP
ncbi:hypothetical protein C6Q09_25415 [Burkholderia multivorans]|nr:DUF2280 domain-containing protein [Burkholderia multivorans]MBU9544784.1 DUF2280 domain-containing protein [Burkholderia multivorans]PRF64072.1 hypothetical protein C6Q09_25415 [Burkholderia multivorans]